MFILYYFVFPFFLSQITIAKKCHLSAGGDRLDVNNPETWKCFADEELHQFKHTFPYDQLYAKMARPKNGILFIGDGLSLSTVTGARYLKATNRGKEVGEELLSWDTWPSVSLLRTMDADRMTTDSAAAATALFTAHLSGCDCLRTEIVQCLVDVSLILGTKGIHYTLGLTKGAGCCSCDVINQTHYAQSILLLAQKQGLSTGIVTTTRITHATPAATYAISPSRQWEAYIDPSAQKNLKEKSQHCLDIAQQLIENGIDFNVVLGGGTEMFHGPPTKYSSTKIGKRKDGKDLLSEWVQRQTQKDRRFSLVTNKTQFDAVDINTTDYLFGKHQCGLNIRFRIRL
ncbi:unnamed protein product [Echinostoma caproni]|uniref:alkaline phosphatase n=1 Tax=Echinostoma caproni TaxID=27848 RepID=A0A183ADT8_9TREM|nr:unnamed protein product [Echinostoma caproni]